VSQPHVLITNDDSIDSHFLKVLVEAHLEDGFAVTVAAPMREQSWIGRATSRHEEVHVAESEAFGCPAWALDGTPSDCVNIALGNLLDITPDVVISGINLGFNASLPLILNSGTVAGAMEGAFWGLPALAFSHEIPHEQFAQVRASHGKGDEELEASLRAAAAHATRFSRSQLGNFLNEPVVQNINFPFPTEVETPIEQTVLCRRRLGSLFTRCAPSSFTFRYNEGTFLEEFLETDAACLKRGAISHTALDLGAMSRHPRTAVPTLQPTAGEGTGHKP